MSQASNLNSTPEPGRSSKDSERKIDVNRRHSSQVAEVNKYFHLNHAIDGRKMRRVIAEDPEWNLRTVPLLSDLCHQAIVKHFETHPRHDELPTIYRRKVLEQIATNLPIRLTAKLIDSDVYWKRCCADKFKVNDVSKYGYSWKRMYFEREMKTIIENFVPNKSDLTKLNELIELGADCIRKLHIEQLLPPVDLERKEFNLSTTTSKNDEDEDADEQDQDKDELNDKSDSDHFDFGLIIPKLLNLEEIRLVYGVKDCGMNFEWQLFEFTKRDCVVLTKCIMQSHNLKSLHLNQSSIDDDKIRLFISQILNHPTLVELDIANNLISDRGSRAIGKLLNGHSKLEALNLCNNQIKAAGAQAIAHALIKNQTLKNLNLRLNRLGDEGGQSIGYIYSS
jgi:hypothetical protein